jgi:hypothetical protein
MAYATFPENGGVARYRAKRCQEKNVRQGETKGNA